MDTTCNHKTHVYNKIKPVSKSHANSIIEDLWRLRYENNKFVKLQKRDRRAVLSKRKRGPSKTTVNIVPIYLNYILSLFTVISCNFIHFVSIGTQFNQLFLQFYSLSMKK